MPEEQSVQEPIKIEVDPPTAFNLKMQEFDKNIATAEAQVYELKRQKMAFIYDRNIQFLTETAMAKRGPSQEPGTNPVMEQK